MSKDATLLIVENLLPRVNPTKKVSEYNPKGKCVDWLMGLADWEAEMESMSKDYGKTAMEAQPRLFWLNGP